MRVAALLMSLSVTLTINYRQYPWNLVVNDISANAQESSSFIMKPVADDAAAAVNVTVTVFVSHIHIRRRFVYIYQEALFVIM